MILGKSMNHSPSMALTGGSGGPWRLQGVIAEVGGRTVAVGNSRLLQGQGVQLDDQQASLQAGWQSKGPWSPSLPPHTLQHARGQGDSPRHTSSAWMKGLHTCMQCFLRTTALCETSHGFVCYSPCQSATCHLQKPVLSTTCVPIIGS